MPIIHNYTYIYIDSVEEWFSLQHTTYTLVMIKILYKLHLLMILMLQFLCFSFQSTERLTLDRKKKRKTIKTLQMKKLLKNE